MEACQEHDFSFQINLEKLQNELESCLKETDFGDKAIIRDGNINILSNPDWKIIILRSIEGKLGIEGSLIVLPYYSNGNSIKYNDTIFMSKCPHIKEIIQHLQPDSSKIYTVRFVKLSAGGELGEHRDEIFLDPILDRIHIPIITHPDVIFNLDKKDYHLEAGKAYHTQVEKNHWVKNKSSIDRIHLIIDLTLPR